MQFKLANGSAPLMSTDNGFAIVPAVGKQYGIIAVYNLAYNRSLAFSHTISLPAASVAVFIPEGVRLSSKQLTDGGTQAYQNQTYHLYEVKNLASGSVLSLTLSGKPGTPSTGFSLTGQTGLLIGLGALGLVLIGVGIFLFLRDRNRPIEEDDIENDADALGDDQEAIMDAIITLDDQFKAGEISKEAYEERRAELKSRLKELV